MKKTTHDEALDELIKDMRDLRVEIKKLKRFKKPSTSNIFIKRCIWCDSQGNKCGECDSYKAAIREGIVHFIEGKIRLLSFDEPLRTNFEKGGMKKLVEEQTNKSSTISKKKTKSHIIKVKQREVKIVNSPIIDAIKKRSKVMRRMIEWRVSFNAVSI